MSKTTSEKNSSQQEQLKFELYIDAVGDGALRSRRIITMLMMAALVAGLSLFNSLRKEHNWFSSRIYVMHEVYDWLVFPDDEVFNTLYMNSSCLEDDSTLNAFSVNTFTCLIQENTDVVVKEDLAEEFPLHLKLKFPDYYLNGDTVNYELIKARGVNVGRIIELASKVIVASTREEMNRLMTLYSRARIENTTLVRMPIVGVSFDINWLSFVSSIAFTIILFLLYYSLGRERKNLRLVFNVAKLRGINRVDFYQMLSMRQVLNVPKSIDVDVYKKEIEPEKSGWIDRNIQRLNAHFARYPLYTPIFVWVLIIIHDISTYRKGLVINALLTHVSLTVSIGVGSIMCFFVWLCYNEWKEISKIWNGEADAINEMYKTDEENEPIVLP